MALIKCPDCGGDVSDAAATCIHCGRPIAASQATDEPKEREGTVRTRESIWWHERGGNIVLLIILGVALLFALATCPG